MPNIKSSTDLRNNYNEISSFCHETSEPVFITSKNGRGDLAVMSIELYNEFMGIYELYQLYSKVKPIWQMVVPLSFEDSMKSLREDLKKWTISKIIAPEAYQKDLKGILKCWYHSQFGCSVHCRRIT